MARIAHILLCHRDPDAVVAQARCLTAAGDFVVVHLDARAPKAQFDRLAAAVAGDPGVRLVTRRVRCGWGQWSLVAATLAALRMALEAFPQATHVYLASADCAPIKSARHVRAVLDARDADHIQCEDFATSRWIKTGWTSERLIYRHPFNERRQRLAFYGAFHLQRLLGLRRALPADLPIHIGAQWWCLRRATAQAVLDMADRRPDLVRFFRWTWIPDEIFFQSLVAHLVPQDQIVNRAPTLTLFSDYGMPVTFHADHHDLLLGQPHLFARKISRHAPDLRARLAALYASGRVDYPGTGDIHALYAATTGAGRRGLRAGPRPWEAESTLGPRRRLYLVVCKNRAIGKRLVGALRDTAGAATLDYPFDEDACPLPDLGGIETTIEKRHRHRRAFLRLVYDAMKTESLILCVDPESQHVLDDLGADPATAGILYLDCQLGDGWLAGHAQRIGLAGPGTAPDDLAAILGTLRGALRGAEARLLRSATAPVHCLREAEPIQDGRAALSACFGLDAAAARAILPDTSFFKD